MNNEIIQPTRSGAIDKTSGTPSGFPDFAFEHDGTDGQANPTLTLKDPWNLEVEGDLDVGGSFALIGPQTIADTTQSTSKDTGCLVLKGGLGIEKDTFIGGALDVKETIVAQDGITVPIFHVQDQKTSGTAGGATSATTWNVRPINTEVTNTITGASLSSNQITLPIGSYLIECKGSNYKLGHNKMGLYNITDSVYAIYSINAFANAAYSTGGAIGYLRGRLTLTGTKVFELRHYSQNAQSPDGLGNANNLGVLEIYTDVFIEKIA